VVPQSLWDTGRALQKVHADGDLVGAFGVGWKTWEHVGKKMGRHWKVWDWKTWLKYVKIMKLWG
jgi:hypothetical protein